MQRVRPDYFPHADFPLPPTEDELPYDDGMPMETHRHVLQSHLLTQPLRLAWQDRDDMFVGSNMFVYYSPDQLLTEDFRGPDVFVVGRGAKKRSRKSWLVWVEGKGPDVVIELLSDSTAHRDRGEKKQIYQDRLRVPEYFWYEPFTGELAGFALQDGIYEPIVPDGEGRLLCRVLGLLLVRWAGVFEGEEAVWLRWAAPDGGLLPTPAEVAAGARARADEEHARADQERARAEEAQRRIAELEARLARYEPPIEPQHPD